MLRRTPVSGYVLPKPFDYPKPRPVIKKTRSWRGTMQVRYDDAKADRAMLTKSFFFGAPCRAMLAMSITLSSFYFLKGHDQFMFLVFGYESESMVETRVSGLNIDHTSPSGYWKDTFNRSKNALTPVRDFEKDPHQKKWFDVFKRNKEGEAYQSPASVPGSNYVERKRSD